MPEYMELNFGSVPQFLFSSYRRFEQGESHVNRICRDDVLVIIFDGVLNFTENHIPVSVKAGEYYIQKSGLSQLGSIPSEAPYYFYIHFRGGYIPNTGLPLRGSFTNDLLILIDELDNAHKQDGNLLQKEALFLQILLKLYEQNKKSEPQSSAAYKIKEWILENYLEPITLDIISKNFYLSKNHVINLFKKEYVYSPYKYIQILRLSHAQQLLISTNRSAEDIAIESGFSDFSCFYKHFRKKHHVSPTKWRNSFNKDPLKR